MRHGVGVRVWGFWGRGVGVQGCSRVGDVGVKGWCRGAGVLGVWGVRGVGVSVQGCRPGPARPSPAQPSRKEV